eukprot:CAMPEP_0115880208 /NCGR_PEP_ID=MMETSP0287-20121206/27748_1 /TAXON_ID=412157 /ORGANISM="Chrysochromulina rotalis, Strain UIO044" /LENGTH=56 /DNA_ID=CAMNT_0003336003 /DNA_START=103 /DNA_END=270 /DNA_ORIENTATION=+
MRTNLPGSPMVRTCNPVVSEVVTGCHFSLSDWAQQNADMSRSSLLPTHEEEHHPNC